MCNPTAMFVGSAVMQGAGTMAQQSAQRNQARQQAAHNKATEVVQDRNFWQDYTGSIDESARGEKYYSELTTNTAEDLNTSYGLVMESLAQTWEATLTNIRQVVRNVDMQRSNSIISAAERGVEGNSVDEELFDFEVVAMTYANHEAANMEWGEAQAYEEVKAMRNTAQSNINAGVPTPVRPPRMAQAPAPVTIPGWGPGLLALGGDVFRQYNSMRMLSDPNWSLSQRAGNIGAGAANQTTAGYGVGTVLRRGWYPQQAGMVPAHSRWYGGR